MVKKDSPQLITPSYIIAFLLSIMTFSIYSISFSVIPLLLSYRMESSSSEIGLILGFSSIGTIVIRPFLGHLVDIWNKRKILLVSFMLLAVINVLFIFASTPWIVFILLFLNMIPFAAASTTLTTIATGIIPVERRGEGLSIFTSASTLALAVGPVIGALLFDVYWYGLAFLITGCLALIALFLSMSFKFNEAIDGKKPVFSLSSIMDRRIIVITTTSVITFMGVVGVISYGTLYGQELGLSLSRSSLISTFYAVGLLLMRLLTGKTLDTKGPKFSGVMSLAIFVVGLAMMGAFPSNAGVFIGASILGGGVGIILPVILTMGNELVPPQRRGICNALVYTSMNIGMSIGATLFGLIGDSFHTFRASYLIFAAIEFVNILIFIFFIHPYYQSEKNKITKS